MFRTAVCAVLACASIGAFAQLAQGSAVVPPSLPASSPPGMVAGLDVPKERELIDAQRKKAASELLAAEKACYRTFSVSSCLEEVRSKNREVLATIRRQELTLNDAERLKKGAEAMKSLDQKQTPEVQADRETKRLKALADEKARRESAANKAVQRETHSQTDADRAKQTSDKLEAKDKNSVERAQKAANTSSKVDALATKQREAAEHRAKRAEANANKAKSGKVVAPLPDPSAP